MKKAFKDGNTSEKNAAQTRLLELKAESEDKAPTLKRIVVNDTTTEKLGEILNENPNGVLQFRDELAGFLAQMEKEGRESDCAFYLESWVGSGRFRYDRIGRGTIDVAALCVSLGCDSTRSSHVVLFICPKRYVMRRWVHVSFSSRRLSKV